MTTASSPIATLKAQSDNIAKMLKAIERGDIVQGEWASKLAAARNRISVTFGVVMDDKLLKIVMSWTAIRDVSEIRLSEYILKQMQEAQ